MEKGNGDQISYHPVDISAEWQLNNQAMGIEPPSCQGHEIGSSMVDVPCSNLWNNTTSNPQTFGFNDSNYHKIETASANDSTIRKPASFDMPWNPPPTLPCIPADAAFIERAARFSSFNSTNFGNLTNTLAAGDSTNPYSCGSRSFSAVQIRRSEENVNVCNSTTIIAGQKDKNVMDCGGSAGRESSEPELSGEQREGDSSAKARNAKKRKITIQDVDLDQEERAPESPAETSKESVETKQKGKQSKAHDEYIHVRARRGQATNSHSLAERVRREKISARMKFLQELVPGCSKVTGKAVMLDEIINYVQSLQRQFLSMKLAAVNPGQDFNMETLHPKDLSQFQGGPSSTIGFLPDLRPPQFHPIHQTLLHAGPPGVANMSDAFQRTISAQLNSASGYKESAPQMANTWENEIQNAIQMTYDADLPPGSQGSNRELQDGFPL